MMAEGQSKFAWGLLSNLLAAIANTNRTTAILLGGVKNDVPAYKPEDFNPYASLLKSSTSPDPIRKVTMSELKDLMPDLAKTGGRRRFQWSGEQSSS